MPWTILKGLQWVLTEPYFKWIRHAMSHISKIHYKELEEMPNIKIEQREISVNVNYLEA